MGIVFELISSSLLQMITHTHMGLVFDPQTLFSLITFVQDSQRACERHKNKSTALQL